MRVFDLACRAFVLAAVALGGAQLFGSDETVRIMTFNVRFGSADDGDNSWDRRKEILLDTIRGFDPDLLGTQEVLAIQVDFLTEHLQDYTLLGVGRNDGKRRGEFSAVLFKSKRFELLGSGTFWLSETPDVPGSKSWDSSLPRIVTWARLRDRDAGGREFCYLNTHWDHRGNQARVESGKLMRRWLDEHARGMGAIVTGDLNVQEDHEGVRALLSADSAEPQLRDVYRQKHPEPEAEESTFHGFSGRRQGRRIDFILASPQWKVVEAAIDHTNRDGHYPSDHYPVAAVLRYAP